MFPELIIDGLRIGVPIIQGGMGVKISGPRLAAAVARRGGIGIIAAADIGADEADFFQNPTEANVRALRKSIQEARKLTDGFLGVNIMVALTDFPILVKVAIEEGIDFIFSGAGLASDLPSFLQKDSKTKLVPIVSSGRAADIIARKWIKNFGYIPDAVVVEGPEAGGHLGFKSEQLNDPEYALEKLVPQVIAALSPYKKGGLAIPVIAAGGIYTGADIYKFLQLGAAGVQMATRFVTTDECDAAKEFKQAYLDARSKDDLVIINSPVGMPGRAIRNDFLTAVAEGKRVPIKCPCHCLRSCEPEKAPYCISLALINAYRGNLKGGYVFAGTNAYRAKKIISVEELMETLKEEFDAAVLAEET